MLFQKSANCKVKAIDISSLALKTAKINAKKNNVLDKISFEEVDFLRKGERFKNKFDIIVSNPPYISVRDYNTLQTEIKNYEPKIALTV